MRYLFLVNPTKGGSVVRYKELSEFIIKNSNDTCVVYSFINHSQKGVKNRIIPKFFGRQSVIWFALCSFFFFI